MSGDIVNDYETLKAGAQAMGQFGHTLVQMGTQFKQIHQQLKEHCSGDESGIGGAVEDATSDAAEAGGDVFSQGGRVLSEMGTRTDTNTERSFGTDQKIADTFDGISSDGRPEPGSVQGAETPGAPAAQDDPSAPANQPVPPDPGANKPIEKVRPYGPGQGSLRKDDPKWQQAMENGFPKDAQGNPVKYADPRSGWVANGNDGGLSVNGRANNCADCSRSFLESWYGRPTCSQPRVPDLSAGGLHYSDPERDANKNVDDYTGSPPAFYGEPSANPYKAVNDKLIAAGPGSGAVISVAWTKNTAANGAVTYADGHAFNAANVNGKVVWVDMQSGQVSNAPIHTQAAAVWATVLDPKERPVP